MKNLLCTLQETPKCRNGSEVKVVLWQLVRRLTAFRCLYLVWWEHVSLCADSQQFVVCAVSCNNMAVWAGLSAVSKQFVVCTLPGEIMTACAQTYSSSWCVLSLVTTVQFVGRLTAFRVLYLVWWVHGSLCPDSQQFVVFTLSGENMAACAQTHSSSWSLLCQVWSWQLLCRLKAVRGL
jgi:hypothetical protein